MCTYIRSVDLSNVDRKLFFLSLMGKQRLSGLQVFFFKSLLGILFHSLLGYYPLTNSFSKKRFHKKNGNFKINFHFRLPYRYKEMKIRGNPSEMPTLAYLLNLASAPIQGIPVGR